RIPKSGGMIHRDPGFVRFNDPKIITGRGLLSDLWAKKIYAICAKLELSVCPKRSTNDTLC
ncbi:MAG: hypothetical protein ACFCD0_19135, partial [Gemmataceae bacterium]